MIPPHGIEIRVPRPSEEDRALTLIHDPPGREAIGVAGREDWALAFGRAFHAAGVYRSPGDEFLVAAHDGEPVGVALANRSGARGVRLAQALELTRRTLQIVPARELAGVLRRARLRWRIGLPAPADSLHVSELHVQSAFQGRGIGAALLAAIEQRGRERSVSRLSLTTLATNPARRLYERAGYVVTRECNVDGYEELTGATGRVLMEKRLR